MSALPPGPYISSMCDGRVRAADGQCIAQVYERDSADAGESLRLLAAVTALPDLLAALKLCVARDPSLKANAMVMAAIASVDAAR